MSKSKNKEETKETKKDAKVLEATRECLRETCKKKFSLKHKNDDFIEGSSFNPDDFCSAICEVEHNLLHDGE